MTGLVFPSHAICCVDCAVGKGGRAAVGQLETWLPWAVLPKGNGWKPQVSAKCLSTIFKKQNQEVKTILIIYLFNPIDSKYYFTIQWWIQLLKTMNSSLHSYFVLNLLNPVCLELTAVSPRTHPVSRALIEAGSGQCVWQEGPGGCWRVGVLTDSLPGWGYWGNETAFTRLEEQSRGGHDRMGRNVKGNSNRWTHDEASEV